MAEKKGKIIYEVIIDLLMEDPERYFETLAELCKKASIPLEYISKLLATFYDAERSVKKKMKERESEISMLMEEVANAFIVQTK